mmetsp:Transcript_44498/g.131832  ORF Transcript_44498/g.131832 Transcript_44498/m.131832 type:complete len:139 (+) Transcript_44498:536-952(+)
MMQFLSNMSVYEQCPQIMTTYSFAEDPWHGCVLGLGLFVNLMVASLATSQPDVYAFAGCCLYRTLILTLVLLWGLMARLDEILNFSFSAILGFSINLTMRFPGFDLSQGINVLHVLCFVLTMLGIADFFKTSVKTMLR